MTVFEVGSSRALSPDVLPGMRRFSRTSRWSFFRLYSEASSFSRFMAPIRVAASAAASSTIWSRTTWIDELSRKNGSVGSARAAKCGYRLELLICPTTSPRTALHKNFRQQPILSSCDTDVCYHLAWAPSVKHVASPENQKIISQRHETCEMSSLIEFSLVPRKICVSA